MPFICGHNICSRFCFLLIPIRTELHADLNVTVLLKYYKCQQIIRKLFENVKLPFEHFTCDHPGAVAVILLK